MSISDLTGTSWEFNNTINSVTQNSYNIFFTVDDLQYPCTKMDTYLAGSIPYVKYYYILPSGQEGSATAYTGSWVSNIYKHITITGGSDVTNSNLISFLEANATMVKHINKIRYSSTDLIDLTGDTVVASKLIRGYTAHMATGAKIIGQMEEPVAMTSAEILAAVQAGWQ